jgi:putative tryptophan/tyrosine transport system substrate-binding protein
MGEILWSTIRVLGCASTSLRTTRRQSSRPKWILSFAPVVHAFAPRNGRQRPCDGKRQEILLDVVPGIHRMAALADTNNTSPEQLQALQDGARARAVELLIYRVAKAEEIASAIDAAKSSGATALNVLASPLLFNNRQIILQRVAALGLPAIYQFPVAAEEGGFIAYGSRLDQIYRDIFARQLVKLLRGAKPADIPVEQPTKFELAVNLKTAKALGLTIPETFLQRADEVIE